MNSFTKKMCLTAMLAAIGYLLTTFAVIPIFTGQAYINFGDAIILFSSAFIGPFWGALVGAIIGPLADLTLGAAYFIPFSIIAKGGEGLISGLLYKYFPKKIKWLAYVLGAIWMIATYLVSYYIIYGFGGLINSLFDLIQGTIAILLATALSFLFKNIHHNSTSNRDIK